MPSGPLAHICLIVSDLDDAVADWTRILSVLDSEQVEETVVRYEEFDGGDGQLRWATFVSHHGAEIQLAEPAAGSALARRLLEHGEFVHHICFTTDDLESAGAALRESGVELLSEDLYSDASMPWQEWTWIGRRAAHGVLVEIAKPYKAIDGRWEPAKP